MEDRTNFIGKALRHYVGCEVDIAYQQKKHYATLLSVGCADNEYQCELLQDKPNTPGKMVLRATLGMFKPKLRNNLQITDEEMRHLFLICYQSYFGNFGGENVQNYEIKNDVLGNKIRAIKVEYGGLQLLLGVDSNGLITFYSEINPSMRELKAINHSLCFEYLTSIGIWLFGEQDFEDGNIILKSNQ